MVNDYYVDDNSSTEMAKSESLFVSCKTFKNDLTKEAFRRNIDFAWRRIQDFKESSSGKINQVKEVEPKEEIDYGDACPDCGGPLKRAGICYVCYAGCGASTGGCS